MTNDLVSSFFSSDKIRILRSNQIDVLNQAYDLFMSNVTRLEIEAPPGSGKSVLTNTFMNYFNDLGLKCIVTSPQNMQVDQYQNSSFNMTTLKGREYYPCLAGKKNCSEGFCRLHICPDGQPRNCKVQEYKGCKSCVCNRCIYKSSFRAFRGSDRANTNFTMLLLGIHNNPDVIVLDEADTCESSIRSFESFVVPELFNFCKFPEIIQELHMYIERLVSEIKILHKPNNNEAELKRISYLETLCTRILDMIDDYQKYHEPWVILTKETSVKTKFMPVTIERFLSTLLHDKIVIMMSATPPHYAGFKKIRVESIFPISSRQWIYDPFPGSLVRKQRDASIPRAAVWLSLLKGKTLVHCKSYETAKRVHEALLSLKRSSLLQINNSEEPGEHQYSRYDAVSAFLKSKNPDEILFSVNQGRGLDLWQPEIVNNVILVMPWQNPTDPLVIAKDKILGTSWKNQEIANEITQMIARHFRNDKMGIYKGLEVPKRAYIIDASFGNWYIKNKGLFPKNFIESQRI